MNYRLEAQILAQNSKFNKAESKIIEYIDSELTSNLNKHLAYNDLILYTYKQFDDNNAIDRCLKHCLNHIKLIPKLISEFKKYQYDFEEEYVISIDIAVIIYRFKKEQNKALDLCNELIQYYESAKIQNYILDISYEVIENSNFKKAELSEINNIFKKYKTLNIEHIEEKASEEKEIITPVTNDSFLRKLKKLIKK